MLVGIKGAGSIACNIQNALGTRGGMTISSASKQPPATMVSRGRTLTEVLEKVRKLQN